jgi:hypothetical protein
VETPSKVKDFIVQAKVESKNPYLEKKKVESNPKVEKPRAAPISKVSYAPKVVVKAEPSPTPKPKSNPKMGDSRNVTEPTKPSEDPIIQVESVDPDIDEFTRHES